MPSPYSCPGSVTDAESCAQPARASGSTSPDRGASTRSATALADLFAGTDRGVAEENLQARIRGNILMAMSNKFGWMVLTTGNKSEYAAGYATLYGDMAGGFAVIKDVPKMLVYALCAWRNATSGRATRRSPDAVSRSRRARSCGPTSRTPTRCPPYEVLDPIIEGYVEDDLAVASSRPRARPRDTVERVARLIDRNEYKRRQAPPGVRSRRRRSARTAGCPSPTARPG